MDNLTHTIVGLATGELIARSTRTDSGGLPEKTRRTALLVIGMIGGNLPDSDIFYSGLASGGDNLGYLLEHRGYTHTLIGCGLLAIVLFLATWLCLRTLGHKVSTRDRWLLAVTTLISVLLHICMDTLNSYGVHPFWPWNNRWYYGDAVFIVEPLYWLAAAPLLLGLRTLAARIVLGLILLVGCVVMLFFHGFAWPWWIVAAITLVLIFEGSIMTPRTAATTAFALMLCVTLGFVFTSRVVEARVRAIAEQQFPDFQTLDVVMSPIPVQPLCWDILLIQRTQESYAVRPGQFSLADPSSSVSCPRVFNASGTAILTPVIPQDVDGMHWAGEFTMPLADFAQVATDDCRAGELMQFNRAPFAVQSGTQWILGDLRFDRESGPGMAEITLTGDQSLTCAHDVPWLPPRSDLLMQ